MTYAELLRATEAKKRRLIKQFNSAMKNPKTGFLVRHELESKPGTIAYLWLAKDFCDYIINHYEELIADPDAECALSRDLYGRRALCRHCFRDRPL